MKLVAYITFFIIGYWYTSASSQYYLRGEVKDENNKPISNAKMIMQSTGYIFYTGNSGGFGITSGSMSDSMTISLDGYFSQKVKLTSTHYEYITLKMLPNAVAKNRKRLISFTKDLPMDEKQHWFVGGETYSNQVENEFLAADKYPETGFAISIDKASYSNVRRFLNMGSTVPPDAVRIEEMLNYFNFGYKEPQKDSAFDYDTKLTSCPWKPENQLLFLKVCARKVNLDTVPPSNLVFLVDISGSMDMPNRLPLLKSAFKLMVNNLRSHDTVSIVVYGSTVGVWLPPTGGDDKEKITKAIEDLYPGGATPGESGIKTAYKLAKNTFIKGGNNRVILATDGDFNVGQANDDELENMISQYRESGIYLTCLGVGMGNYKDSKLEVLAKKGNGNFSYIDDEKEGEKVLVKELTQTMYAVADDVYLNVKFNDAYVKNYRLIGFDNKIAAISDTMSQLEGGEVGSGHTLMAMFEIEPTTRNEESLHQPDEGNLLASIAINYKYPNQAKQRRSIFNCPFQYTEFAEMPACHRFATSVVMFGFLLKHSHFAKGLGWNDALLMANESFNPNDALQKEFLVLIEKAKKIYAKERKRKSES